LLIYTYLLILFVPGVIKSFDNITPSDPIFPALLKPHLSQFCHHCLAPDVLWTSTLILHRLCPYQRDFVDVVLTKCISLVVIYPFILTYTIY